MGKQITRDDLRDAESVRDRIGKLEEDTREYHNLSEELAEHLRAAKALLKEKQQLLEECAAALTNLLEMIDHMEFPARGHEGACGPESGCDGICMELASMGQTVRESRTVLEKLQAAGITK